MLYPQVRVIGVATAFCFHFDQRLLMIGVYYTVGM